MGTYGRHAEFRQPPIMEHRLGRYFASEAILQLAPVIVPADAEVDGNGRLPLELATGAQAPAITRSGIAVWEELDVNFRGSDAVMTRPSDRDTIEALQPCQLVHGTEVRLALWSYEASSFDGQRSYPGRIMVPGVLDATPTTEVGELLTPGVGNDTDGYWAVTAVAANAWLRITNVIPDRGLVEAQLLF